MHQPTRTDNSQAPGSRMAGLQMAGRIASGMLGMLWQYLRVQSRTLRHVRFWVVFGLLEVVRVFVTIHHAANGAIKRPENESLLLPQDLPFVLWVHAIPVWIEGHNCGIDHSN